jgi:ADP-heptose:LPS heptosyltransferase
MEQLQREVIDETHHIAVVRMLLGLGDLLCLVPALRALRARWPRAHVAVVGLEPARLLRERFPRYVDELIQAPGWPGIPECAGQPGDVPAFVAAMQARRLDLALQMHGSGEASNPFTALLGARRVAGYVVPGGWSPDPRTFLPFDGTVPEVRRHLALLEHLGVPARGDELELPLGPADRKVFDALPERGALRPGEYACLHPGASNRNTRWPAEAFAAVADRLAAGGLRPVLTGLEADAPVTARVRAAMRAPALDLVGRTTLGALGVLLTGARLLVCNDTGVSHVAAALGVPSVVIFTGSDARRWAPLDRRRHRPVGRLPDGEREATPDDVLAEAAPLLHETEIACVASAS